MRRCYRYVDDVRGVIEIDHEERIGAADYARQYRVII